MMELTTIERDTMVGVYTVAQQENASEYVLMGTVVDFVATDVGEDEEREDGEWSCHQVYGTLSTLQRRGMINVGQITEVTDEGKKIKHKTVRMIPDYAKRLSGRHRLEPREIVQRQASETEQELTRGLEAKTSTRESRMARLEKLRQRAFKAQQTMFRAEDEWRRAVERAKAFGDVPQDYEADLREWLC